VLKAVIFDMGGTLEAVYHKKEFSEPCGKRILEFCAAQGMYLGVSPAALIETIEKRRAEYGVEWAKSTKELSPYELWANWFLRDFAIDQTRLKICADHLADIWERVYHSRTLRPDAKSMLQSLKKMGLVMGIISNTTSFSEVYDILYEYGIREFFDCVYLSAICGYHKPEKELFLAAAGELGFLPGECAYVGDTIAKDVRGARLAGYHSAIRIKPEPAESSDPEEAAGDEEAGYVIKKLSEIPAIIAAINRGL
jgi:putative hydrolase of the HAD superfamily